MVFLTRELVIEIIELMQVTFKACSARKYKVPTIIQKNMKLELKFVIL